MKKIGVCGVYGDGPQFSGGQPVKVKTMIRMLSEHYGIENIETANTAGWRKHPIKMLLSCFRLAKQCGCIVILPAHNGLKVFLPLFLSLKKRFHYKLFYSVVGGWLAYETQGNKKIISRLGQLDGIWVETNKMKDELQVLGLENVIIIPNVKYLEAVEKSNITLESGILRCCTFCRVIYEKGIEDAIQAVCNVNACGQQKVSLDIYGPIYEGYKSKFNEIIKRVPQYIRYMGCTEPNQSVATLCQYDLQIFPTHYQTEGIPGSIIDSYAAAVPVLASRWNSFNDIVLDGVTGIGFVLGDISDLTKKLLQLCEDRQKLLQMSHNCLQLYNDFYKPESVIKKIVGAMTWD